MISCCVTSCDRHDLLKTTLESLYKRLDAVGTKPSELIIYEDSDRPMPDFLRGEDIHKWRGRGLRWIQGRERLGQAFACARLIQEAKHEFVFWLEEDWLFQTNDNFNFLRESEKILKTHPEIIMVSLRGDAWGHPLVKDPKFPFQIAQPYWRGVWGGWAWNPGLRRLSELRSIVAPLLPGHFGGNGLAHEEDVSKRLLDRGYRIADFNRPIITHIGGGRSRAVEKTTPFPKILIAVPTCFELRYETHQVQDCGPFHKDGPNDQTQAVRETWARDFAAYPNVHVRFFYGKPVGGYPRQPQSDEIFLEVGDGYDSLIQKSTAICEWAVQNGYKFIYKCDTDTFVYADRLLIEIMENSFHYAGYVHGEVCSGGPGYLLSDTAARIVATQGKTPRHPFAEDVHVSRVLAANGIHPLMLPAHRPGFSAHYYFGDPETFDPGRIFDDVVSAHSVFPSQMRAWHAYKQKYGS